MSLDHGLLNLPLSKRGDIDAEIDRLKACRAAKARAERSDLTHAARIALAEHEAAMVDRWTKIPDLRAFLRRTARFDPDRFLHLVLAFRLETEAQ